MTYSYFQLESRLTGDDRAESGVAVGGHTSHNTAEELHEAFIT